jgi:uncharacterized membrane protein YjjP (DUF1212 family)
MNNETIILLIWLAIIAGHVIENWYLIVKKKEDIDHEHETYKRLLTGFLFALTIPLYAKLEFDQWLALPLMMAFSFWALFDVLLNLARGKSIFYFGEGSKLDRIQSRFPQPAVFFKFLFAGASILLFYKGLYAVVG